MFYYDAFFRSKSTEPRWLIIIRAICSTLGAGLLIAYAVYVIKKVLQDSNATTTTTQNLDVIAMPNILVCSSIELIPNPKLSFYCFHLGCNVTTLTNNGSYPAGSYGSVLELYLPYPCYHITYGGGIINTTIEDYYTPGITASYAYDNGTGMSNTDYFNSSYSQEANQWQITFFEPSTDPINTLFSPAPASLTRPPCYFNTILCSGCVDETSCNLVFSSVSDSNQRSQVIDYVLNGDYTFLLNSSQWFEHVTFQGMQVDISVTSSWKNRLGITPETSRVSKILIAANELPLPLSGSTAFRFEDIGPHGRITVITNEESRTDTVLTALGAIGGIFTLIQGIYKLLFGKTSESPWGLVQTYAFGNLRNKIFNNIKDSYALDGDNLPLTAQVIDSTPRSLEKLNQRLEALERMLAEHYVDASMLENIQKSERKMVNLS